MTLDRKKQENKIWTDTLELCIISTAYYLLDKLGLSPKKVIKTLSNISSVAESVRNNYVSLDDLRNTLEEEYKVTIKQNCKGVIIEYKENK